MTEPCPEEASSPRALNEPEARGEIDCYGGVPCLEGLFVEGHIKAGHLAVAGERRIVHEDVQAPVPFMDLLDDRFGRGRVSQIGTNGERLPSPVLGDLSRTLGALLREAIDEDDLRAVLGEYLCVGVGERTRATGDDGHPPVQSQQLTQLLHHDTFNHGRSIKPLLTSSSAT